MYIYIYVTQRNGSRSKIKQTCLRNECVKLHRQTSHVKHIHACYIHESRIACVCHVIQKKMSHAAGGGRWVLESRDTFTPHTCSTTSSNNCIPPHALQQTLQQTL